MAQTGRNNTSQILDSTACAKTAAYVDLPLRLSKTKPYKHGISRRCGRKEKIGHATDDGTVMARSKILGQWRRDGLQGLLCTRPDMPTVITNHLYIIDC